MARALPEQEIPDFETGSIYLFLNQLEFYIITHINRCLSIKEINMGKRIAFLLLIGGGLVIYSLMTATVSVPILVLGLIVLVVAFVMFIKEIAKI